MYNTNFSASNPVQTSDEYSFEGTKKMKKKRSSFSLSTIIGAVVFGVLVLGVIAANMGSQQSQDLRNQASGPSLKDQMEAGKGGETEGTIENGTEVGTKEGTIAMGSSGQGGEGELGGGCDNGVPIGGTACRTQGDSVQYRCLEGSVPGNSIWSEPPEQCGAGNSCQGTSCQPDPTSTSCAYPTCDSSCSAGSTAISCGTSCASGSSCQTGKNTFYCRGRSNSGCNDVQAYKTDNLGSVSFNAIRINREDWCSTVQIDAWAAKNLPNGTDESDYAILYVGDNGQYCIEYSNGTQSCNPNTLDWDCTVASPSPSPSPTPSCPAYESATVNCLIDQASGEASMRIQWDAMPNATSYIVRADHRWGNTAQCRNTTTGQMVGWYCPASSNTCAANMTCRDVFQGNLPANDRSFTIAGVETNVPYRITVQQNGGLNCTTNEIVKTCEWTPTTSPSPSPVVVSPVPLTCNSSCTTMIGKPDPCTKVNPNWFCFGETYPGGNTIIGNCRHLQNPDGPGSLQCVVPTPPASATPKPSPTPMGPMCLSIARQVIYSAPGDPNPNTPDVGDQVVFYCGSTANERETVSYEFRWMLPNGVVENLSTLGNVGNQSSPYTIQMPGQYHAQCRVCVPNSKGAPTCQQWEPLPGGDVQGAYSDELSESADPVKFDEAWDVDSAVHFNSTNASSQQ